MPSLLYHPQERFFFATLVMQCYYKTLCQSIEGWDVTFIVHLVTHYFHVVPAHHLKDFPPNISNTLKIEEYNQTSKIDTTI